MQSANATWKIVKTMVQQQGRTTAAHTTRRHQLSSSSINSGENSMSVGRTFTLHKDFSQADVDNLVAMIGDKNPIHVDALEAQRAGLKGRIVPGILIAALFPSIIGSQCPGAIYASQQVTFRRPAIIGESLIAEVVLKRRMKEWAIFDTTCRLKDGTLVAEGEAKAKLPS